MAGCTLFSYGVTMEKYILYCDYIQLFQHIRLLLPIRFRGLHLVFDIRSSQDTISVPSRDVTVYDTFWGGLGPMVTGSCPTSGSKSTHVCDHITSANSWKSRSHLFTLKKLGEVAAQKNKTNWNGQLFSCTALFSCFPLRLFSYNLQLTFATYFHLCNKISLVQCDVLLYKIQIQVANTCCLQRMVDTLYSSF
jgi:hypothetical protein